MADLPTLATRVHAPFLVATCAYCSAKVDCVDGGAFELSPGAHSSTSLTIHLPSEVLAIIFSHVLQFPTKSTATLYESSLVSKHWNLFATPILYSNIKIQEWDWRIKGTLLRTLDACPSLLLHIRSLSTNYPRFEEWRGSLLLRTTREEYGRLFYTHLEGLDSDNARVDAQNGGTIIELWEQAEMFARSAKHVSLTEVGATRWMDSLRSGDSGRRAGACELLALVSRSPSIQTLRLDKFDFGEVAGDDLEARLPISLDHIVTLALNTTPQQPNPLPHFLSRLPNVESLDIGDPLPNEYSKNYDLPKLAVFRLRSDLTTDALEFLEGIIDDAWASLRKMHVRLHPSLVVQLSQVLSAVSTLEELSLEMPGTKATPFLPELFTFLVSHSSLKHLSTLITLHTTLVESLPPNLVSLAVAAADPQSVPQVQRTAQLTEGIGALIESKKTRTPALALVRIGPVYRHKDLADLVEAARGIGLEIRLERKKVL